MTTTRHYWIRTACHSKGETATWLKHRHGMHNKSYMVLELMPFNIPSYLIHSLRQQKITIICQMLHIKSCDYHPQCSMKEVNLPVIVKSVMSPFTCSTREDACPFLRHCILYSVTTPWALSLLRGIHVTLREVGLVAFNESSGAAWGTKERIQISSSVPWWVTFTHPSSTCHLHSVHTACWSF